MNDRQYFEKRLFDALLELNRPNFEKPKYKGWVKGFVSADGSDEVIPKYAVCYFCPHFHSGDLLRISDALAAEGLEIRVHTISPVDDKMLSVFVWVRGTGEEQRS